MLTGLLEQTNIHTYITHMILLANVGGGGGSHMTVQCYVWPTGLAQANFLLSRHMRRSFCWWNMSREFVDFLNKFKFQPLPTFKFRVSYFMLCSFRKWHLVLQDDVRHYLLDPLFCCLYTLWDIIRVIDSPE